MTDKQPKLLTAEERIEEIKHWCRNRRCAENIETFYESQKATWIAEAVKEFATEVLAIGNRCCAEENDCEHNIEGKYCCLYTNDCPPWQQLLKKYIGE